MRALGAVGRNTAGALVSRCAPLASAARLCPPAAQGAFGHKHMVADLGQPLLPQKRGAPLEGHCKRLPPPADASRGMTAASAHGQQLMSVAPMMDWTDVHWRQFARLLSKHTWLWTEMVVDQTLIFQHPNNDRFLWFPEEQHPVVLQLGGSDPEKLQKAAELALPYGYDEINLNCGCPSDRVAGAGCFGASLMLEPQVVADCCAAMNKMVYGHQNFEYQLPCGIKASFFWTPYANNITELVRNWTQAGRAPDVLLTGTALWHMLHIGDPSDYGLRLSGLAKMLRSLYALKVLGDTPLTIKCRLGVDDVDSYPDLVNFIRKVSEEGGIKHFIMHARKAHLKGLNPHQNRTVPPLRHQWVFALKRDFPHLDFSVNGGVKAASEAAAILESDIDGCKVEGVMIGRAAYNYPWQVLAVADTLVFGAKENPCKSRRQLIADYSKYADSVQGRFMSDPNNPKRQNPSVRQLSIPLLALFHGEAGNRKWKQTMDVVLRDASSVTDVIERTIHCFSDEVMDAPPALPDGMSAEEYLSRLEMLPDPVDDEDGEALNDMGLTATSRMTASGAR